MGMVSSMWWWLMCLISWLVRFSEMRVLSVVLIRLRFNWFLLRFIVCCSLFRCGKKLLKLKV